MDWLGFIPGIGDIIDAINAIIYFIRGKYLDGALSLIAIIPVIGSGLKMSMKVVMKPMEKAIAKSLAITKSGKLLSKKAAKAQMTKAWMEGFKKGDVGLSELQSVTKTYAMIGRALMQGKSIIRNAPMLTAKGRRKLAQYLDNQAKAMKTYEEAGEIAYKSIKAIEKAKKLVGKPFRTTVANLSKINKGFGPKIGPRLKKLYKRMGMGADQKFIKQIKRDMDIGFIKRASQNSDIGYSLWRTSGKSKAQLNDEFMNFARGVQQRNPKDSYKRCGF